MQFFGEDGRKAASPYQMPASLNVPGLKIEDGMTVAPALLGPETEDVAFRPLPRPGVDELKANEPVWSKNDLADSGVLGDVGAEKVYDSLRIFDERKAYEGDVYIDAYKNKKKD